MSQSKREAAEISMSGCYVTWALLGRFFLDLEKIIQSWVTLSVRSLDKASGKKRILSLFRMIHLFTRHRLVLITIQQQGNCYFVPMDSVLVRMSYIHRHSSTQNASIRNIIHPCQSLMSWKCRSFKVQLNYLWLRMFPSGIRTLETWDWAKLEHFYRK